MKKLLLDSEISKDYPYLVINRLSGGFWGMCDIENRTCLYVNNFILRGKLDGSTSYDLEIFIREGTSCATCPLGRKSML